MGIVSLSYLFGDAAARQFLAVLIGWNLSWRAVFAICAGVLTAILTASWFVLRESPADIGEPEPQMNPDNLLEKENSSNGLRLALALFKSPAFCLVCAVSLGTTILRETLTFWSPTYFTQVVHMNTAEAAQSSSVFPLLGGVSVILCGWLSDRLGRTGRAAIILAGMVLSGAMLVFLGSGQIQTR